MNLYFIRHGETEANNKGLYYGKTDYELTSRGRDQSEKLSRLLSGIDFDSIYVSEKKRAIETAKIAVQKDSSEFIVDKRINEMNLGEFEGKSYTDIEKLYPKLWKKWCSDWKNTVPPGGESYIQFYRRVRSFMEYILKCKDDNVLIVTHSGIIRSVYCYVLNNTLDFFWRFASHNGDLSIIKYEYNNLYIDSIICLDRLKNIV